MKSNTSALRKVTATELMPDIARAIGLGVGNELLMTFGADDTKVTDDEVRKKLIAGTNAIVTTIGGLADVLDEPLKAKFLEMKGQFNQILAGMAPTDAAPMAMESNSMLRQLLCAFQYAQQMMGDMKNALASAKEQYSTVKGSIPDEVKKDIDAKVTAGELLTKASAETAKTEAVNKALKDERAKWESEKTLVSTRLTTLGTAKVPVPVDHAVLATGDDAAFTATVATVKDRITKLTPYNLPAETVTTLAWNPDPATFETQFGLIKVANPNPGAPKRPAANGFVSGAGELKKKLGVC